MEEAVNEITARVEKNNKNKEKKKNEKQVCSIESKKRMINWQLLNKIM